MRKFNSFSVAFAAALACCMISCDKSENEGGDEPEKPAKPAVVYVTGNDTETGVYWKNSEPFVLKGVSNDKFTQGKAIAVNGSDVYVAGWETKLAVVWKNGEPTALSDNTQDASANAIAIFNGDVYAAGYDGNSAVL